MTAALPRRGPALRALTVADLCPGDLLLRTNGWDGLLVRWLDESPYDHAGLYDGERVITCGAQGIGRLPLYTADVYRFRHADTSLGEGDLDARVVIEQATRYLQATDRWGAAPLHLAGQLAIMRRWAEPPWRRMLAELFGGLFLERLQTYVGGIPAGATAVTSSELITCIFCDAKRVTGVPYDIVIELDSRHGRPAWPPTSGRFERLVQEIEEVLTQANPQLLEQVARARFAMRGQRGAPVVAGGPLAPACLVSPGDLAHSQSFARLGHIAVEPAERAVTERSSIEAPSADRGPARQEEKP